MRLFFLAASTLLLLGGFFLIVGRPFVADRLITFSWYAAFVQLVLYLFETANEKNN